MATDVWFNLNAMVIGALRLSFPQMIVFRWFVGFISSRKMQNFKKDDRRYFWVLHKKAADDLKFTTIKTERRVDRVFKSLVKKELLYFLVVQGNSSWYALTSVGKELANPLLKTAVKQITRPADHKSVHPQARAFSKPDFEMPATILKRVMPDFKPC